jgi:hypothetical protein
MTHRERSAVPLHSKQTNAGGRRAQRPTPVGGGRKLAQVTIAGSAPDDSGLNIQFTSQLGAFVFARS